MFGGARLWRSDGSHLLPQIGEEINSSPAVRESIRAKVVIYLDKHKN